MKKNKLTISIDKPVSQVFEFTTNPQNTHLWVSGMTEEKTNEWPISLGTIYSNTSDGTSWDEYEVTELENDKLFTLSSKSSSYNVRYTYRKVGNRTTEMEYYEWVDEGELDSPFSQDTLNKLKDLMESN